MPASLPPDVSEAPKNLQSTNSSLPGNQHVRQISMPGPRGADTEIWASFTTVSGESFSKHRPLTRKKFIQILDGNNFDQHADREGPSSNICNDVRTYLPNHWESQRESGPGSIARSRTTCTFLRFLGREPAYHTSASSAVPPATSKIITVRATAIKILCNNNTTGYRLPQTPDRLRRASITTGSTVLPNLAASSA